MKTLLLSLPLRPLLFSLLIFTGATAGTAQPAKIEAPPADRVLRAMSQKLGAARQFQFHAEREIDPTLIGGRNLPAKAQVEVTVQRPNKLVAKSSSKGDVRHVYVDGRTLTMVDARQNFYATVPMRTSLDGLGADIHRKYGFTPPLAEFTLSNIYTDIRRKTQNIRYVERERLASGFLGLSSVECHRFMLTGRAVDAELWVAVGDQLPRKMVATVKARAGRPQVKVRFSDWNLAPKVTDRDFVFVPWKGATKIPMRTTAEMAATPTKAHPKAH
jgi:hypothetical protein